MVVMTANMIDNNVTAIDDRVGIHFGGGEAGVA